MRLYIVRCNGTAWQSAFPITPNGNRLAGEWLNEMFLLMTADGHQGDVFSVEIR